jgi:hypothetical protein
MKRSLVLIYFVLLFLSFSNLANAKSSRRIAKPKPKPAVTAPVLEEALPPEEGFSPASQNLEKDLLAAVGTFDRNFRLYHYFQAPTDENNPQKISPFFDDPTNREQWVPYFIGFRTGAFWDPNNHVSELINAGPGMYLAIDPNASREFGDSAIVLNVPSGLNYLSVVKAIPLRKITRDLLVQENIITKNQLLGGATTLGLTRGFSGDALKNMVREENGAFKKLVNQIFTRNQIMFIEYEYKSHLAGFCKVANQSAFVFVGQAPDSLEPNQDGEVLGKIPDQIRDSFLYSDFDIQNQSESDIRQKDVFTRFRNVLAGIREKGTGKAQELMNQYLNDEEVNELADESYRCERRY